MNPARQIRQLAGDHGLIDFPGKVIRQAGVQRRDLQDLRKERRQLVGSEVAMIFRDPMTSLNPCYTVGYQIMEALKVHQGGNRRTRRQRYRPADPCGHSRSGLAAGRTRTSFPAA